MSESELKKFLAARIAKRDFQSLFLMYCCVKFLGAGAENFQSRSRKKIVGPDHLPHTIAQVPVPILYPDTVSFILENHTLPNIQYLPSLHVPALVKVVQKHGDQLYT